MNAHPLRADSGEQTEKGGGNVGPIRYQISVRGRLSERLGSAFAGMIMEPGAGQTVLLGEIRDQSHLYGILDRVRSLGLELVSVQPLRTDQADDQDEGTRARYAEHEGMRPWARAHRALSFRGSAAA